ncbi:MAG TPA: DUF305 domain-containing protein [Longimicrobiales bacterium]|nr:DUF305 domain-containing protein [Longimicrobiales bacterium]
MIGRSRIVIALATSLVAASCVGGTAPPASAPAPSAEPAGGPARAPAPYTRADVAFMQGMIVHHAQALDMTALVPARSGNASLRILAERIEATQEDEILRMSRWLAARGETVPDPHAYREHMAAGAGGAHGTRMPGMLSPEQMEQLAAGSGHAFDRMFLQFMIEHHIGALTMVEELQQAGGGLEAEIYRFASDVDADQRAEIARMWDMLTVLPRGS